MSIRAVVWALDQKCPSPTSKLVLITLASFLNPDGECWPSQARIASDCGMTRQSVNVQIKLLEKHGLLENKTRINSKGQQTSLYFLRCQLNGHPLSTTLTPPVNDVDTEPVREPLVRKKDEAYASSKEADTPDLFATPQEKTHGTRGSRLSPDWQPSAADCAFAAECGLDPIGIADRFRDYWIGADKGVKRDWPATWRNWCRSEMERQSRPSYPRPGSNGSGGSKLLAAVRRIDTSAARARLGR